MTQREQGTGAGGETLTVEFNGQQQQVLDRLIADDPRGRDAETFIREGLVAFAKRRRRERAGRWDD